jgi:hypothetical protein
MSALDFLGQKKIPRLAFLRKCRGSGSRPNPVMMDLYVLHYECAYCGARFNTAEAQAGATPDHEAVEGRVN